MLDEKEIAEIHQLLAHAPTAEAAIPDALKVVQAHHGWVSDGHLADVSALLGKTAEEVDSVATFYNLVFRRQVGRHVILVCDSVSCWVVGYQQVLARLKERLGVELGQTTADGKFTLLPVCCLGACDRAPVMMVDKELYGPLDEAKVDEALGKYQ